MKGDDNVLRCFSCVTALGGNLHHRRGLKNQARKVCTIGGVWYCPLLQWVRRTYPSGRTGSWHPDATPDLRGLTEACFDVVCMEARQVNTTLSAMRNKTDKNGARGIDQLLRSGWYSRVHVKSVESHYTRALLRLNQSKSTTVESPRGNDKMGW